MCLSDCFVFLSFFLSFFLSWFVYVCRLVGWLVGWLAGWLVCLFGVLVYLFGLFVCWLVGTGPVFGISNAKWSSQLSYVLQLWLLQADPQADQQSQAVEVAPVEETPPEQAACGLARPPSFIGDTKYVATVLQEHDCY